MDSLVTQNSRREGKECKTITRRSSKELEDPQSQNTPTSIVDQEDAEKDEENEDGWVEV